MDFRAFREMLLEAAEDSVPDYVPATPAKVCSTLLDYLCRLKMVIWLGLIALSAALRVNEL